MCSEIFRMYNNHAICPPLRLFLTIASHSVWENILYGHNYGKWERGNRLVKTVMSKLMTLQHGDEGWFWQCQS